MTSLVALLSTLSLFTSSPVSSFYASDFSSKFVNSSGGGNISLTK